MGGEEESGDNFESESESASESGEAPQKEEDSYRDDSFEASKEEEDSRGVDPSTSREESSSGEPKAAPAEDEGDEREEVYAEESFEETSGDKSSAKAAPEEDSYGNDSFDESSRPATGGEGPAASSSREEESYGEDSFQEASGQEASGHGASGEQPSPKPPRNSVALPAAAMARGDESYEDDAASDASSSAASEASESATPAPTPQATRQTQHRVSFADDNARPRGGRRPSVDCTPLPSIGMNDNDFGGDDDMAPMQSAFTATTTTTTTTTTDDEDENEASEPEAPPAHRSGHRISFADESARPRGGRRPSVDSTPFHSRGNAVNFDVVLADEDGDMGPMQSAFTATTTASGDGASSEHEAEGHALGLAPPQQTGSRRPSLVSFAGSFEGDPGVDRPSNRRSAGESTPHPAQRSGSFFDEDTDVPKGRKKSVTWETSPVLAAQGDDGVGEQYVRPPSRRNSLRKSIDSTPRFAKDVWGAHFVEAFPPGEPEDEDSTSEEDKSGPVVIVEEQTEVIVEDAADSPSGVGLVTNAGIRPTTPQEEWFMVGRETTPQGPPGLALRSPAASRSSSSPALLARQQPGRKRRPKAGKSPPAANKFDRKAQSWDTRFHLVDATNGGKPRALRQYFSRPSSLPQLREHLAKKGAPKAHLQRLDEPEVPSRRPEVPISADSGPPVIPGRHRIGGKMETQGKPMPWNNRWHTGVHMYNEGMHPLHRAGFSRPSVFEESQTQVWRRQGHVEVANGVWSPAPRYASRFPPLGV